MRVKKKGKGEGEGKGLGLRLGPVILAQNSLRLGIRVMNWVRVGSGCKEGVALVSHFTAMFLDFSYLFISIFFLIYLFLFFFLFIYFYFFSYLFISILQDKWYVLRYRKKKKGFMQDK